MSELCDESHPGRVRLARLGALAQVVAEVLELLHEPCDTGRPDTLAFSGRPLAVGIVAQRALPWHLGSPTRPLATMLGITGWSSGNQSVWLMRLRGTCLPACPRPFEALVSAAAGFGRRGDTGGRGRRGVGMAYAQSGIWAVVSRAKRDTKDKGQRHEDQKRREFTHKEPPPPSQLFPECENYTPEHRAATPDFWTRDGADSRIHTGARATRRERKNL